MSVGRLLPAGPADITKQPRNFQALKLSIRRNLSRPLTTFKVFFFQPCTNGNGIKNGVFLAADKEILHEWMVKIDFNPPKA